MLKLRLDKIISLLSEFCILAVIFFVPVYFALFLKTANVFTLNKIVLFKILVLLLLFLTLVRWSRQSVKGAQSITRYWMPIVISLLFLISLTISTFFSLDPETGFYGLYDRQQGLISHVHYVLFFILLLINIRTRIQINRIIIAAVFSSFFVCLYGLAQAAGIDPLSWSESTHGRIISTFGQPNILAAYLLLVLPLSGYLCFASKRVFVKLLYFFILVLNFLCLFFTYSRSAWLGLIVSSFLAGVILLYYGRKRFKKLNFRHIKFGLVIIVLVICGFIYLINYSQLLQKNRIKYFFNPKMGSVASRVDYWQAGIAAVKLKPFFGYGPENQKEVFISCYKKDWAVYNNVNVVPNRAHNIVLDILLTSGIVGLIAYLALLFLFFKILFKNIRGNRNKPLSFAVLFGALSYLLSLLFSFTSVTTEIYFWLFLAIIILIKATDNPRAPKEESDYNQRLNFYYSCPKLINLLLILFIGFGVFYQINKQIKILIADHYFRELQIAYIDNDYFATMELYDYIHDNAPRYNFYDREFVVIMADLLKRVNGPAYRQLGEIKLEKILEKIKAETYDNTLTKARIYTALANTEKQNYYNLAEENYKAIIRMSPEMPKNYQELAMMYSGWGKYKKAIENYETALAKLPCLNTLALNPPHRIGVGQEMRFNYLGLKDVYIENGNEIMTKYYDNLVKDLDNKIRLLNENWKKKHKTIKE